MSAATAPAQPARSMVSSSTSSTNMNAKTTKTRARKMHQRDSPKKVAGGAGVGGDGTIDPSIYISMLQNFDDEAELRRRALQEAIASAEKQLIQRLEEEIPILIEMIGDMTVGKFINYYKYDVNAAYEDTLNGKAAVLDEDINKTIRKRKRVMAGGAGAGADEHDNDNMHTGSPLKARKNMRMAPPTPKMMQNNNSNTTNTLPRSSSTSRPFASNTASRASYQQQGNSNNNHNNYNATGSLRGKSMSSAGASTTASTSRHGANSRPSASSHTHISSSNAGNFIYKARPSMTIPTNFNGSRILPPQTPKALSNTTSAGATATGKSTAKRLPRKNESIQAYSINGSPLGLFDLAIEQQAAEGEAQQQSHHGQLQSDEENRDAGPPSSSAAASAGEDWEVVSSGTSTSATAHPGLGYMPPRNRTVSTASSTTQASSFPSQAATTTATATPGTPLGKVSPSKLARKTSHSVFKNKIIAGASKAFGGGGSGSGTSRFASPTKSSLAMAAGNQNQSQNQHQNQSYSSGSLTRPPSRDEFTFSANPPLPSIPSSQSINVFDQWEAMRKDLAKMVPDPEQRKVFEQRYFEVMQQPGK